VKHHEIYVCTECLGTSDEIAGCGWCNELQMGGGDLEHSYHTGCEFCDGHAGSTINSVRRRWQVSGRARFTGVQPCRTATAGRADGEGTAASTKRTGEATPLGQGKWANEEPPGGAGPGRWDDGVYAGCDPSNL
jgi:hypothetical protein